jgi:glycosyltransferase involved in cell wall biosynthesis
MNCRTGHDERDRAARLVAWVVPGPLRQVTGGYLYDARIFDGLRARGWPVGVVDIRSGHWPLDPPAGQRLLTALRRERWSAVVVDELAHPALVAALFGGRLRRALRGTPLVLLVHHLRCSEPAPRPVRAAALLAERAAIRSVDLVICTSATTARNVRSVARAHASIEVVRPGWDTHGPGWPSPPGPLSLPWERGGHGPVPGCSPLPRTGRGVGGEGLPQLRGAGGDGSLRLLLVGHWTPRKGILAALDALARVRPQVTLDLVGDQDRDPAYAEHVWSALRAPSLAGRVRVHGHVSQPALATLFADADALLLSSTHEGYGMVLAEALAAGLPIVATRVGAVPEVVRDGFEAVLVPPGDAAALARAIEQLAADPTERRHRAELARERAATLPCWSESVVAFERHLQALLARRLSGT